MSGSVWTDAQRVFLDVTYEDRENGLFENKSFKFQQGDADQAFRVRLKNPRHRTVSYTVTFLMQDGSVREVPRSLTQEPRIFVTRGMTGHKLVLVRPEDVDFTSRRIREMTVELNRESGDERVSDRFTFRSPGDGGAFEFNYADAADDAYRYRVAYTHTNGLTRQTDWQETDAEQLVVPVG